MLPLQFQVPVWLLRFGYLLRLWDSWYGMDSRKADFFFLWLCGGIHGSVEGVQTRAIGWALRGISGWWVVWYLESLAPSTSLQGLLWAEIWSPGGGGRSGDLFLFFVCFYFFSHKWTCQPFYFLRCDQYDFQYSEDSPQSDRFRSYGFHHRKFSSWYQRTVFTSADESSYTGLGSTQWFTNTLAISCPVGLALND